MRFLYTFLSFFFIITGIQAQNFEDAWRYSQDLPIGTARFTGMSGAFSSLGGDLSAVGLNPAGATTFTTNRITGTFSFYNTQNTASYFNQKTTSDYSSFDDHFLGLDQLGGVWVFQSDVSDWNKVALSINYNRDADYGNHLRIAGTNTAGNSATQYFVDNATGIALADIKLVDSFEEDYQWLGENIGYDAQQAYLGYQAYVINPVDPSDDNNTQYVPNALWSQLQHVNTINSTGNKSHFDFTLAGTYQKKLQLGFSFSTYGIEYTEQNTIEETNYDATSDLQYLKLRNTLRVEGSGMAIKLGGIYKVAPGVKLSLAYHSPQWLEITEYMKQAIHTEMGNGDVLDIQPGIENEFAPYKIITPSKFIVGGSAVINKKGLISIDYTYQNMARLHFKEKDADADTSYFDNINDDISNTMQPVHKLNVGGEIKLDKLTLRGGGFMATSPVKADSEAFTRNGFSAGLGYDFGGFALDLAFIQYTYKPTKSILTLPDTATVQSDSQKFSLGIRYNF